MLSNRTLVLAFGFLQNEVMNDTQLFLAVGMPTLVVLIGIPINHWQVSAIDTRITDLRQDMHARFNDLKDTWRAAKGR